jgi:hypothetical protein
LPATTVSALTYILVREAITNNDNNERFCYSKPSIVTVLEMNTRALNRIPFLDILLALEIGISPTYNWKTAVDAFPQV